MDSKIKVSIITVTRNAEKTIDNLFNSIRKIKTSEIEFIILDGLSTDRTIEMIKKNEDIIDFWKSEEDTGIYNAMNKSISLAKGHWLIFIGADDELLPSFETAIPLLKDEQTIYYGRVFFHGLVTTGKIKNDYTLIKTNICHQAIFYPRSVFQKYKYIEEYVVCADYVLNLTCWSDPLFKFIFIDKLISNYSIGGYSGLVEDKHFKENKDKLFKQHLSSWAYFRYCWKKFKNNLFKKHD